MTAAGSLNKGRNTDVLIGNALLIFGFLVATALVLFGNATIGMSRVLYVEVDLLGFCIAAAIAGLSLVVFAVGPVSYATTRRPVLSHVEPWHAALAVLVAMILLIEPAYHSIAYSMDEYMTRFQAEIFGSGRLSGEVPPGWRDVGRALHHDFARYNPANGLIYSSYRPGMAALYALFELAGLGLYTSAILSAGSVILVASISRRLWPRSETAPLVAALILATSQQVVITGLTSYAMPAHLFFNLLWVRLFLVDRMWAHAAAAIVGVATSALHQVHTHVFFAAPFLLSLFRPFRPRLLLCYGVTYALGLSLIVGWDQIAMGAAATGAGPGHGGIVETARAFLGRFARIFRLPGSFEFNTIAAQIVRFLAWQNLVLLPLLVVAARRSEWSKPVRLLAASIAFSLLPYLFLMPDQGHGWGYRYLHGLIGNVALIATSGWLVLETLAAEQRRRLVAPLVAAGVLSVVIMLPLRVIQVERTIAPFAQAYRHITASAADVVVVDTPSIRYGQDLVRNGPFLGNRPVVVDLRHLNSLQVRRLCEDHPGSVELADAESLARFEVQREASPFMPPPDRGDMLRQLRSSPCADRR